MYQKKQRIAALIGLVLIFLFLIGLVASALINPGGKFFYGMLFGSIALPILLWIYIWLFGKLAGKHTIADFDLPASRLDAEKDPSAEQTVTFSKRTANQEDLLSKEDE